MRRSPAVTAGLAISALLGVVDIAALALLAVDGGPPLPAAVLGAIVGVATLAGVAAAWRGNRAGLITIVVARSVDLLRGLPLFLGLGPDWARVLVSIVDLLTIVSLALLAPALLATRRGAAADAGQTHP